ncbi:MAG TPA: leucyl aminopeptidase [Bacteroidales bacterium]|nr:leucyl aminopeptidase [Bacteroidales bacterium]
MKLKIQIVKEFSKNDSLVVISKTAEQLLTTAKKSLAKEELMYLKKKSDDTKKGFIKVNRLNQHLYFYVIGSGKKTEHLVREDLRKMGCQLVTLADELKLGDITLVSEGTTAKEILAFVEGVALSAYQFLKYKSKASESEHRLKTLKICSKSVNEKQLQQLLALTEAVHRCRDFVNEPVCKLNSTLFAKQVSELFKNTEARVEIFNKSKIEALKMNGLLAVNSGSIDPPAFIIIEWNPPRPVNKKPYVFVGKGIMYDTGGINVKSAANMETMKDDMAGGAAVVAALYAITQAKLPVHVVGLVPVTDNRPSGNSLVPGDIINYADGTSVEVLNSDAEGRLILADALIYAKKYKPQLVITLATLTGAAQAAIGSFGMVGMEQKSPQEFKEIVAAGNEVFERVVEFPFWEDYDELIKSDIADIKNTGGRFAGAITAGKFLAHFTRYPFIHLDIAGPAYNEKKDSYRGAGGSGVGVRLLYEFMERKTKK